VTGVTVNDTIAGAGFDHGADHASALDRPATR